LSTNATAYESVFSQLGSAWQGPSSSAMTAAAQPYIAWLNTTSAQLQQAAIQATSSAAAYEAAFMGVIPPAVIAANRAQLAVLVATNILGQNTPAIMANEAMYAEFWAQDAAVMYGYAGASAAAAQLSPLTPPAENTNPAGSGAQAAAVSNAANSNATSSGLNGLLGNLQNSLSSAANPAAASSAGATNSFTDLYNAVQGFFGVGAVANTINSADVTLSWCMMMFSASMPLLGHFAANAPLGFTIGDATPLGAGLGFGTTLAGATSSGGVGGGAMLAGMGTASEVGGLSVPAAWSAAAPAETGATLAGTGWTAAADEGAGMAGMPGVMPGMASVGGKAGMGFGGPRYGVKPIVMPKQVFV
jgi:PPE-repeat protein